MWAKVNCRHLICFWRVIDLFSLVFRTVCAVRCVYLTVRDSSASMTVRLQVAGQAVRSFKNPTLTHNMQMNGGKRQFRADDGRTHSTRSRA